MTKKELEEKLATMPDDMPVFVAERKTDFAYGLVNSVYIKEINFSEEPDGEVLDRYSVIVLDEV